jgi:pyrroloquinoline quinone biosynthesis protein D
MAIAADSRPALARGVRLMEDKARGGWSLLAPERVLRLNATSAAVLRLCDGSRPFAAILDELAAAFEADRSVIERDARKLLTSLSDKLLVAL